MSNKYLTHIKPYLKEIERWAKAGDTSQEIAGKLSVGYSTFRKYVSSEADLSTVLRNSKNYVKRVTDKALMQSQQPAPSSQKQAINNTPLMTYMKDGAVKRPDQNGTHRKAFERAKKKIYATQDTCGICGKPIDFTIKYPNPLSPCIDHIIPVAKGGHPSDMSNLQLAHWTCNRQKSDKLTGEVAQAVGTTVISNRILPQSIDWTTYRSNQNQNNK